MLSRRRCPSRRQHRHGAVMVEVAITIPILFLFFFFFWEFSRAEMLRHTAATAAYEGARKGIIEGGTAAETTAAAQAVLNAVGVRNPTIVVNPATIGPTTESVQVAVTIPLDDNAVMTPFFFDDLQINSDITLNR